MAKRSKQRLDSTHICGLLSHTSRLECVRETIRLALEYLERRQLLPESWATLWDHYVESKVDHRCTVEALKTKFLQAGKDMCTILEWANTQDIAIKDAEAIRLAQRVFDENYERDEQGGSINRPVHSPPERCIIRTSLRLNGIPSPPSRTKPGWATKHRWQKRYRRNPVRQGNRHKTSSPPSSHKMRRRATSPVWLIGLYSRTAC
ncbi:MAG: Tnp dom protein [Candidatus Brocadiaceae bacterium]|nr:Tnp dom protein [Candidatus Brocadiaceae bacterium]